MLIHGKPHFFLRICKSGNFLITLRQKPDQKTVRGNAFLHLDQRSGISCHIPQKHGKELHPSPASDSMYFPNRILDLISKNMFQN